MPIKSCQIDGKPGFKWGDQGKCYTFDKEDEGSKKAAKKKAIKQGIVIEGPDKFKKIMESDAEDHTREALELLYDQSLTKDDLFVLMNSLNLNTVEQSQVFLQREMERNNE